MSLFKTLIVEDNFHFRQALRDILSSQFPYMRIEEADDGREALEKVDVLQPELVFMDIRLPGESGLNLTERIKHRHPETMVIILTSYDFPEYRDAAFQYGANYFIGKGSIQNVEILTLIEAILKDSGFEGDGSKGGHC